MGRPPLSSSSQEDGLKKGPWSPEEDKKLSEYIIDKHGHGSWRALPRLAGLNRCGKSCRLRWMNYLRPDIRRGSFSEEEERLIVHLHSIIGNKWSKIAAHLPGRTDNEIKNFWNIHIRKKLLKKGIDPNTHKPIPSYSDDHHVPNDLLMSLSIAPSLSGSSNNNNLGNLLMGINSPWEIIAINNELAKLQVLQSLIQFVGSKMDYSACNSLLETYNSINNLVSQHIVPPEVSNPNSIDLHRAMNLSASLQSGNARLPALWPSSPEGSTENNPTMTSSFSTESSASLDTFEDLEKLLEDGTCASFLRDLLHE